MKIAVFTLADYVTEQSGKLIIVGSFDNWLISKFPFSTAPFGVAIKCYVEARDFGKRKKASVRIRPQGNSKPIFVISGDFIYPPEKTKNVETLNLKFMITSIQIEKPGVYLCELEIDGQVLSSIAVEVIDTTAAAKKKAKKKTKKKKKLKKKVKRKVKRKVKKKLPKNK